MTWTNFVNNVSWLLPVKITILDILQALLLSVAFFYLLKSIYKSRAWVLAKGLLTVGVIYFLAYISKMTILSTIMDNLFSVVLVAIVIMLQPELQKIVERVGTRNWRTLIKGTFKKQHNSKLCISEQGISEIINACQEMGGKKTGALIVIEKKIPLKDIIDSGISLKAELSGQLLVNIFEKNTPLHDGAVVIKDNKVEAATCYLPLTKNPTINKHLGTRHRAAVGASESSDCVVIIVSEETGAISLSVDGEIKYNLTKSDLANELHACCAIDEDPSFTRKSRRTPLWIKIIAPVLGAVVALTILSSTDPVITTTIEDIPVDLANEFILNDLNQIYTIDGDKTVDVTVTGKRSKIDRLTADNFIATADVSNMSMVYSIPIEVILPDDYSDIKIDTKNAVLKLRLEETSQIEIPIEVTTQGVNDAYLVHSLKPEIETLTVSGAQSVIKTLDKAVLTVNIENRVTDFSEIVTPKVYDKNGNEVRADIVLGSDSIKVDGTVYATKEVAVNVNITEQDTKANEYYVLNNVQLENRTIRVAAEHSILSSLKKIDITIAPDASTVEATSLTIKLSSYLPENIYLAPTQPDELTMSLDVTRFEKISISLTASDIKFGVYDTKKYEVSMLSVPVIVEGYINTSIVSKEQVTAAALKPTLAISETVGSNTGKLTLQSVDGFKPSSDVTVKYSVKMIGGH